ncbi:MAG: aminotransferase class III-fold pyridoxal phosphate-dependent enzyme, partial [Promethearchaeota archaeon]
AEEYSDIIKEARGRGLMWGVEFFNEEDSLLSMFSVIKEGVMLNYCGNKKDTLIIMPPLIVKKEEIEEIIEIVRQGLINLKKIKKR